MMTDLGGSGPDGDRSGGIRGGWQQILKDQEFRDGHEADLEDGETGGIGSTRPGS